MLLIAIAAGTGLWLVAERLTRVARRRLIAVVPMKPAQLPAGVRAAIDSVFADVRVAAYRRMRMTRRSTRGSSSDTSSSSGSAERCVEVSVYTDRDRSPGARLAAAEPLHVGLPYHVEVAVREKPIGMTGRPRHPVAEPGASETAYLVVTLEAEDPESALVDQPVQGLELLPEGDSTRSAWFRLQPRRRAG